jgi:hypothetical protein
LALGYRWVGRGASRYFHIAEAWAVKRLVLDAATLPFDLDFQRQWKLGGLGALIEQGRGLAALPAAQRDALFARAETTYAALETTSRELNTLGEAGVLSPEQLVGARAHVLAVREQLDDLVGRLERIEPSDVEGWEFELAQLERDAASVRNVVAAGATAQATSRLWQVGIWTGAAVAGAIGLALLIRWASKRKGGTRGLGRRHRGRR